MGSGGFADEPMRMSDGMHRLFNSELRIATVIVDATGTITYFGPNAETLTGFRHTEIIGRDLQVVSGTSAYFDSREYLSRPPGAAPEFRRLRRSDGSTRAVQVYRHPLPKPTGPPDTLLLVVDVAENAEAEVGLGLLNAFFQQSTVGFVIMDTELRYVALNEALARLNRRPIVDHLGRRFREIVFSTDMDAYEALLKAVIRTGEPVTNLHVAGHPTAEPGTNQAWSVSCYRIAESSGRPAGLCGVVMDITTQERSMIDSARTGARLALLSEIGAAQITTLRDFRKAAQKLTEILVSDFCDMAVVDVVHSIVAGELPPDHPTPDTLVSRIGGAAREPSDASHKLLNVDNPRPAYETDVFAHALLSNRPQKVDNPRIEQAQALSKEPEREQAARQLAPRSVIIAPLRARDVTLGALTFVRFGKRKPFDEEDVVLAGEIAERTALGIDNSRLYGTEKNTALTLQRSLLPLRLSERPEVSVTYRYRPSRSDLRAGGDWFDMITLPGHRVALVVGDVAGHGITAAAAMGQYRTAVRTLAHIGLEPSVLLTRLNELAFDFGTDITATCVYVLYDPVNHNCVIARAGHPPPVLATTDGVAEILEVGPGPLLGALTEAEYQAAAVETPPGTRLLMYSDGVVESRHQALDDGIAELVRHLRTRHADEEVCDRIMETSPSTEDDRTVLLARFHGLRSPG
ncbi:SpoIIE family protein phosphatase [Stackebrandtia nassauensis]|uniref:protein-serine/threonine phosphatase n=1 Tax=Stackebrandtia nassauensis (strain DSM 44728 / CIP 108903 / NRRL B-16338 / NBRC 102104 / LLR-40K-21) TaxID=446470 RepID=D3Q282_STANL|nr:SpoIIE family protein phosphatase [Stackebrandtia nassauensis]ADD43815.1 putative PAS/PAC sensor protein [Stackebrandtia nassauensis DSM 44728]